jgi:hypothetical protein
MLTILRAYTGKMTPWVRYSLIRIGLFAAVFAILMVIGLEWWVSALLATVIAFSISYIFFVRQRDLLAEDLAKRVARSRKPDADSRAEDGVDESEGDSPSKA